LVHFFFTWSSQRYGKLHIGNLSVLCPPQHFILPKIGRNPVEKKLKDQNGCEGEKTQFRSSSLADEV
jgi:hypothetical protein